jgi:hypothetical protein
MEYSQIAVLIAVLFWGWVSAIAMPVPSPIHGLTLDSVSSLPAILTSIGKMNAEITTRVVFDEKVQPDYYLAPLKQISTVSNVMGELLDSFYVKTYSVAGYVQRAKDYTALLGGVVDIWEIGNEANGEWLGATPDVVAKISGAYDVVKSQGLTTELTLYYNQDC